MAISIIQNTTIEGIVNNKCKDLQDLNNDRLLLQSDLLFVLIANSYPQLPFDIIYSLLKKVNYYLHK